MGMFKVKILRIEKCEKFTESKNVKKFTESKSVRKVVFTFLQVEPERGMQQDVLNRESSSW